MKTTLYDKHYIDCALTDAKNKNYETEFVHPNKRLRIGCKYSYSLNGVDYFIYHEYFDNRNYYSDTSAKREEIFAHVTRYVNTPIEKLINSKYL